MKKYIINQVNELVNTYNTRDPFELAEALDILVMHQPLGKGMDGLFVGTREGNIIIINDSVRAEKEPFVIGHELSHANQHNNPSAFTRRNNPYSKKNLLESETHIFTAELLIDKAFFLKCEGKTIGEISGLTGIPENILNDKYEEVFKRKGEFQS